MSLKHINLISVFITVFIFNYSQMCQAGGKPSHILKAVAITALMLPDSRNVLSSELSDSLALNSCDQSDLTHDQCSLLNLPQISTPILLEEDSSVFESGQYIFPNEGSPHVYRDTLKSKTGTFIAIGGIHRVFSKVLMGEFSRVIIVDYDGLVTEFNNHLFKIIKLLKHEGEISHQRYQFMAALRLRWLTEEDFQNLNNFHTEKAVMSELLSLLQKKSRVRLKDLPKAFQNPIRALRRVYKKLKIDGEHPFSTHSKDNFDTYQNKKWASVFKHFETTKESHSSSFWRSDSAWEQIQKLIDGNYIQTISADLTGSTAFRSIAKALRKQREVVSVVDLSNSVDYVQNREAWGRFKTNMAMLPRSSDFSILFTRHGHEGFELPDVCGSRILKEDGYTEFSYSFWWYYFSRSLNGFFEDPCFDWWFK